MRSRDHLFPAEPKIEAFLTDLAVHRHVTAATQNQAMKDLVFLYKRVFTHAMEGRINAVCAAKKMNVAVVMAREEVATGLTLMNGTAQLVAKLLYGRDLRIMEAIPLRVKDFDNHLAGVKTLHQQNLAQRHAWPSRPPAGRSGARRPTSRG
jgi:site-specific recombinase XerD